MQLFVHLIEERNFHNAWAKAIHAVLARGTDMVIGGGAERKPIRDSCMLISMTGTALTQIEARELHPQAPFKRIEEYCKEFTRPFLAAYRSKPPEEQFSYLYFERLAHYEPPEGTRYDQLALLKAALADQIEQHITSNRAQAITWYVPGDLQRSSPPCLQRLQVRYLPERMVDVHFTWRSRDLFTAWQSNIICLTEMLNREVVKPNNCRIVRIIDYSDSLHLYARDIADAKKVTLVPVSPQELQQGS
jgi:thymidylate synthase